jgi:hypothetical protein
MDLPRRGMHSGYPRDIRLRLIGKLDYAVDRVRVEERSQSLEERAVLRMIRRRDVRRRHREAAHVVVAVPKREGKAALAGR